MFLHMLFSSLLLIPPSLVTCQMSVHCLSLRSNVLSSGADPTLGPATFPFCPSQLCFHPSVTWDMRFPLESRHRSTMWLGGRALTQHAQSRGFSFQHHKTSKYELYGVRGCEYFISVPLALSPRPDGEEVFNLVAGRSVNPWMPCGTQRASGWSSS